MANRGEKGPRETDYDDAVLVHHDVIEDILAKLPVKTLIRFKSVSKQWCFSINNPNFTRQHLSNQRKKDAGFLFAYRGSNDTTGFSKEIVLCSTAENYKISRLIRFSNILPQDRYNMSHSCDGIICFYGQFNIHLINYSTLEIRTLPPGTLSNTPHYCYHTFPDPYFPGGYIHVGEWRSPRHQLGIGRDEVTKQYKIVKVFDPVVDYYWHANSNCEIFTLDRNPNASWKNIGIVPYKISFTANPVHVNGAIYWFTDEIYHGNKSEVIVMFDLHRENFQAIPHPSCCSDPTKPRNTMQLATLRGSLCLFERLIDQSELNVWIMKTCERSKVVTWENIPFLKFPRQIGPRFAIAEDKDEKFCWACDWEEDQGGQMFAATTFTDSLVPLYGQRLQLIDI
ncbi:hypothetical protein COLO4_15337 [Corchorus olitorius]|uniref:F-box domain-containing protein n=1 Tax=Corchorus olitorius TaxID=93759 RepID=A0A1R3JNG1_9ROSI|nr:hypothetical protein COLO4_15337 [Corchorus olitorius]